MIPPMTDDLVGRLRERMAAASEQPWVYRPNKHDDWGWIRGAERDSDIGRYRPIVANAKNSEVGFDDMQPYRDAGTDPYGPNALLIAEAVNALPTLLARIEALEGALIQARSDFHLLMLGTASNETFHEAKAARDRVHAALAKDKSDG